MCFWLLPVPKDEREERFVFRFLILIEKSEHVLK